MLSPNMYIESDPIHKEKVAVAATFAPSFGETESSFLEVVNDKNPDSIDIDGKDFHFVFIIDRSGSMEGENI